LALAIALLLILPQPGQSAYADGMSRSVSLEQVSKGLAGRIGVAAQLIGGTEVVTLNGDATFVMASTFKVAVAAALLDRVDKGEIRLDQRVDISPDMFVSGGGVIGSTFVHPGISLSVANLIEVMITESDNTATDICAGRGYSQASRTGHPGPTDRSLCCRGHSRLLPAV